MSFWRDFQARWQLGGEGGGPVGGGFLSDSRGADVRETVSFAMHQSPGLAWWIEDAMRRATAAPV